MGSMWSVLAFVASGELDAVVSNAKPASWDSISGAALIEEAAGIVIDVGGGLRNHGLAHETEVFVES